MSFVFNPQLTLATAVLVGTWLGLGWLVGRLRGLRRAGCMIGVADIVFGLASGRLLLAAGGAVTLACWLLLFRPGRLS
jgi:hypothetical protein